MLCFGCCHCRKPRFTQNIPFFLPKNKQTSSLPHVAGTPSLSSSPRAPHTARLASAISGGRGPMSDLRWNQSSQVTQLGSSPTRVHSARLASAVLQSYCPCPAARYHLIHGPVPVRGPGVGEHGLKQPTACPRAEFSKHSLLCFSDNFLGLGVFLVMLYLFPSVIIVAAQQETK